ncbi:unnamed protein product [Mucor fragilis]
MSPTWLLATGLVSAPNRLPVASVLTARRVWRMSALVRVSTPTTTLGLAPHLAVVAMLKNGGRRFNWHVHISMYLKIYLFHRGDYRFAFKVPDSMPSEVAATFYCGGATCFAPLSRAAVGPNSVVGILGIGGLGHYGVLFAKAMGAKVIAMSHSDAKAEVAKELGCDDFIVTSSEESMAKYKKQLTHILCTGTSPDFSWNRFFTLLKVNGHFINVSAPGWDFPQVGMELLRHQVSISGSVIASPGEMVKMLDFVAEHNIRPWIKTYPMSKVNEAIQDFRDRKPRFRLVLKN